MGGTFVPKVTDPGPCRPVPSHAHPRRVSRVHPRRWSHPWYDGGWPVLAGLGVGGGLVAAYTWMGPLELVVSLVVLEVTVAPIAWCVLTEFGGNARGVTFRVAPWAALATMAVVGFAQPFGSWTILLGAVVLVTSPLLRGWTEFGVRRALADRFAPQSGTWQRFDEIVAHFGTADDELPPA